MTEQVVGRIESENQNPNVQPHFGGLPSQKIDACRKLVADRYKQMKYIDDDNINPDGHLDGETDGYVDASHYFWIDDAEGQVAATFRLIRTDGARVLPIETSFSRLEDEAAEFIALQRRSQPESIVEISALAKRKGMHGINPFDIYKSMWQYARRENIDVCAMSADAKLYGILKELFGPAIEQIGEPEEVMGSKTVPALLYPKQCAQAVYTVWQKLDTAKARAEYAGVVAYLKQGLDDSFYTATELVRLQEIHNSQNFV